LRSAGWEKAAADRDT
jgi:CRP-like cAMP-binding protein